MKSVLLVPNTSRDPELEVTAQAARLLSGAGFAVWVKAGTLSPLQLRRLSSWVKETGSLDGMELLLALGGDGTILRVAQEAAEWGVPILGINLGKVGFMAELERQELAMLPEALSGPLNLERRMMQRVSILRRGESVFTDDALNDAVVTKGTASKIVDLEISADGVELLSFSGDGAIVATPTGSTAYSMSAGGPIVEPAGENLILTPVCAFALHARSFVFAPERVLDLRIQGLQEREAYLSIDGRDAVSLLEGDRIHVERSPLYTSLVRFKKHSFYDVMMQKLLWR